MSFFSAVVDGIGSVLEGTPLYEPASSAYAWSRNSYARQFRRYRIWRRQVSASKRHPRDSVRHTPDIGRGAYNEYVSPEGPHFTTSELLTLGGSKAPGSVTLGPHPFVDNPVLSPEDVPDALATYVADPFVVQRQGTHHMFFEIKDRAGDAFIAHARSTDGVHYSYDRVVIPPSQAQHSYPMVFHHEGEWYMTPSPVGQISGQFRIYRARDFPYSWEVAEIPLEDRVRIDPTPFKFDGTWYLIFQETETFDIVLWYSDSLLDGSWHEHPASPIFSPAKDHPEYADREVEQLPWGDPRSPDELPIVEDVPSGRPIVGRDHVEVFYRRTVEGTVHHFRIDELSKERFHQYELQPSPLLRGTGRDDWNGHMMHTVNLAFTNHEDKDVVLVDGLEREDYVWHIGVFTIDGSTGDSGGEHEHTWDTSGNGEP